MNFNQYWNHLVQDYPERQQGQLIVLRKFSERLFNDIRSRMHSEGLLLRKTMISIAVPNYDMNQLKKKLQESSKEDLIKAIMNDVQAARSTLIACDKMRLSSDH